MRHHHGRPHGTRAKSSSKSTPAKAPSKKVSGVVELDGKSLTLEQLVAVAREGRKVKISKAALTEVDSTWNAILLKLERGGKIYGMNMGVGSLHNTPISLEEGAEMSLSLCRSHACGVGDPLPEDEARASALLLINSLAKGHSSIRSSTLKTLGDILNSGITPVIPAKGSVGSSGDLAPLAHMALAVIGEGEVHYKGKKMRSAAALRKAGLEPVKLAAGEGLALINGTTVMTGIGALALHDAKQLSKLGQISAALVIDILHGDLRAYSPDLHNLRPHPGIINVASNILKLTEGSELLKLKNIKSLQSLSMTFGHTDDNVKP